MKIMLFSKGTRMIDGKTQKDRHLKWIVHPKIVFILNIKEDILKNVATKQFEFMNIEFHHFLLSKSMNAGY